MLSSCLPGLDFTPAFWATLISFLTCRRFRSSMFPWLSLRHPSSSHSSSISRNYGGLRPYHSCAPRSWIHISFRTSAATGSHQETFSTRWPLRRRLRASSGPDFHRGGRHCRAFSRGWLFRWFLQLNVLSCASAHDLPQVIYPILFNLLNK